MKCTLPADINKCPHYEKKWGTCINPNKCSMQDVPTKEPEKKDKWYSQYYR